MRNLFLFDNITLNGFIEAPGHDISIFTRDGEAFSSARPGREVDAILLGRRTYELMRAWWPTPEASAAMPDIARFMNEKRKLVATRQPAYQPGWSNVTVLSEAAGGDVINQVRQLKQQPGGEIILFGSNSLAVGLLQAGLLDEVQVLVNPLVIGDGTPLFKGLEGRVELALAETLKLKSGSIMLTYTPAVKNPYA